MTATEEVTATEEAAAAAPVTEEAAVASPVTVESARPVNDIVGEKDTPFAAVSPDGAYIAWYAETGRGRDKVSQICLFTFATAAKQCYELSDQFEGYPYQLQWSPDSKSIAFTENPITLGYYSHIWLFDVADGSSTNLTDNGVYGTWTPNTRSQLNYLPMWNPADGQIYFWQATIGGGEPMTLGLYPCVARGR